MNFYVKEFLIIVYILKSYALYFDRLGDLGFTLSGIIYVVMFLFILLGLLMLSYIQNNTLRLFCAFIIFVSAVFVDAYENITSDFLTYNMFIVLLNARGFANEAFNQYFLPIATSVAIGIPLLVGMSLKPKYSPPLPNLFFIFFPIFVLLSFTVMLFIRGGDGAKGLPSAFTPLAYSSLAVYETFHNVVGTREGINIKRIDKEIGHDIVLIIDESISANYLDINTKYGVLTNLNHTHNDINIYNYGYAASISNCSSETNITIRYGGTRKNYLSIISTMPSIWKYAKKAKMHTVYIDAQRTMKKLQNGMTDEELANIDEFIQFDKVPVVDRDIAAARILVKKINNKTHDFIIFNKIGAHFPIHDKYPDQFMMYKPVLPRGDYLDISDTGSRKGFSGKVNDWVKYRNSYRNSIRWSVGEFFSRIFKGAKLDNTIIIYTSDHGQDLHERGNPGLYTHCSPHPNMEEGLVPLVIIEGAGLKTLNWKRYLIDNKNRSSHYNIFPTLLLLMLYDNDKVKSIYGNSLNKKTEDGLTFNTRFHARLGKKPTWKKIDINKIIIPTYGDLLSHE